MGRGLLLWGAGSLRAARERQADGATLVAWPGSDTAQLQAERVPFRRAEDVLGPPGLDALDAVSRSWARVWARLPLAEGSSFRELVSWRGDSLLWAAEGFLRRATAGPRCARTVELCLRLFDALAPGEVDVSGLAAADTALVARAATARGVLFHGEPGRPRRLLVETRPSPPGRLRGLLGAAQRPPVPAALSGGPGERLLLVVLSDSVLEAGVSTLLDAVAADAWLKPVLLPLGALAQFETPRVRRALDEARQQLRASHTALRGTPALAASYVHRGVGFADLAAGDLEALLCAHLPGAVRRIESAVELLESARPALLLLGVEERDERRALGIAARVAGVPWAVLRVSAGEPDDMDRADFGPQPAATLELGPGHDLATSVARVREAMRGSVETP
jgi:hypothetical protein